MLLNKAPSAFNYLNKLTPAVIQIKCFSAAEIGKRYPKTFDYKNKYYNAFTGLFDVQTVKRLEENSLIITVDGNFGAGKSAFAKRLAKEIDFIYASELDIEKMLYIRKDNGANKREIINNIVGNNEMYRLNTLEDWHTNPMFKRSIQMQYIHYYLRWMQFRSALLSLFSTGQGIVLERSPFSDNVIAKSLFDENLMSKEAYNYYKNDLVQQTICELWRPHVTIYLDRTPENCLKSINQNGKEYEKNSKVYTTNFLKTVENNYKKSFLPEMGKDIYVLNYDNNQDEIPIDEVIGDLEALDFDVDGKFSTWRIRNPKYCDHYRVGYV